MCVHVTFTGPNKFEVGSVDPNLIPVIWNFGHRFSGIRSDAISLRADLPSPWDVLSWFQIEVGMPVRVIRIVNIVGLFQTLIEYLDRFPVIFRKKSMAVGLCLDLFRKYIGTDRSDQSW